VHVQFLGLDIHSPSDLYFPDVKLNLKLKRGNSESGLKGPNPPFINPDLQISLNLSQSPLDDSSDG